MDAKQRAGGAVGARQDPAVTVTMDAGGPLLAAAEVEGAAEGLEQDACERAKEVGFEAELGRRSVGGENDARRSVEARAVLVAGAEIAEARPRAAVEDLDVLGGFAAGGSDDASLAPRVPAIGRVAAV